MRYAQMAFSSDIIRHNIILKSYSYYKYIYIYIIDASFWKIFDSDFRDAQQWTANGKSRKPYTQCVRAVYITHYVHCAACFCIIIIIAVVIWRWAAPGIEETQRTEKLIRFKIMMIMKTSWMSPETRTHSGHPTDVYGNMTPSPNFRGYSKTISPQVNTHNGCGEFFYKRILYTRYDSMRGFRTAFFALIIIRLEFFIGLTVNYLITSEILVQFLFVHLMLKPPLVTTRPRQL